MASDTTTFASLLEDDGTLEDMLKQHRHLGVQHWSSLWEEYTTNQKFAAGVQWAEADQKRLDNPNVRAPRLTFNQISQIIQTFSGREIMQRFERAYIAQHPSAATQAEVMTLVDRKMMSACDAEQVISAAFKDGPGIQGASCLRWELDTLNERGGGLLLKDLPMWQVMVDPESRYINFSDRAWHRYGQWMSQSEVRSRWPDKYADITSTMGSKTWSPKDNTFSSRIPWVGMGGNRPLEVYYPRGKSFWIEHEEWREVSTHWEVGKPIDEAKTYEEAMQEALMSPEGGEPVETMTTVTLTTSAEVNKFKEDHFAKFNEKVPKDLIVKKDQLVYKYAYICGDLVLETDLIPTGFWTYQFLTGFKYPLPDKVVFKSLISRLIDPQKWINVFMSALIRNIQITPKGLLFVEEGFFKNRNEAMSSWAAPGGLVMVGRGKLTAGQPGYKLESGGTQPYAQMVSDLLSVFKSALPEMAGFNPGALGQLGGDLRRISGEVVRQVQDAAMTSNAESFDSLRLCRREGGRIFMSFLSKFFEVEDIIRIVGEDVAYETVMEPVMEPVLDPATGQPVPDPMTGQPQMKQSVNMMSGEPLTKPMLGEDGAPVKRLVVPDKSTWDSYKDMVTIEDVVPSGDQLQVLWKSLETSMPTLLQAQPDTGMPLFTSEDLAEIIPEIPASRREKMLQRIKTMKSWTWQQQMAQQQMASQQGQQGGQGGQGGGAGSQPTNGSGQQVQ